MRTRRNLLSCASYSMRRFRAALIVLAALTILPSTSAQSLTDVQAGYRQFSPSEVLQLAWGSGNSQVGLLKVPGGNYGPQSFAVDEAHSQFYILDSTNNRILIYASECNLLSSWAISGRADDIALGAGGDVYVLFRGSQKVVEYSPGGSLIAMYPLADAQSPITGIHFNQAQGLSVETADEHTYPINQSAKESDAAKSVGKNKGLRRDGDFFYLERGAAGQGSIAILNSEGEIRKKLAVNRTDQKIVTLSFVGVDDQKSIYVALEVAPESLPVRRYIRKYDSAGVLQAEALVPYSNYVYTLKDLRVTGDGKVYQLLPLKEHVKILLWHLDLTGNRPSSEFLSQIFAYTTVNSKEFLPGDSPLNGSEHTTEAMDRIFEIHPEVSIAASSVLSRAESYRTHVFTVGSNNITGGVSCGGKTVQTYIPSHGISSAGTYTGVPYKWGGFSGLTGVTSVVDPDTGYNFNEGLAVGKYAGDLNTTGSGSSCAVGVDCSGFVSQTWGLSSKQSTGTLPNYSCCLNSSCTYPSIPSYPSYLLPGDILNSDSNNGGEGHVRLVSTVNADGTLTVYESSARTWNVSTYSYSASQLSPKYYYPYRGKEVTSSLQAGNTVQTSTDVNVRSCASMACDPPICTAPTGSIGTLSGTPQDAGGYIWWQVSWSSSTGSCPNGTTGWSVGCYLQKSSAVSNPMPVMGSLSPTSATAGGSAFTLTVYGSSFINGSVVRWNGSNRTTTYLSSGQLQATITSADIASSGSASVTVYNSTPGGGTSGTQTFTITPVY
jgi:hypothetical protein